MQRVFIGSEALATGAVTRHGLARWFRRLHPDVYFSKFEQATLHDRITGAWLWSGRSGVIAGVAASALHGAEWVDADIPVELLSRKSPAPHGIIVRNERVADDEATCIRGLTVTTPARTAFDIARHLSRGQALARLDALARATPFCADDVLGLAKRYPGARGLKQLRKLIPLVDRGADSLKESWLRLLLIDAGFPTPKTQIPVYVGGRLFAVLDMGWEEFKVSAEYDGEVHRTVRSSYVKDHYRERTLPQLGWLNNRVIKEDTVVGVIDRVAHALWSRGWQGQPVYPARSRSRR
ncbi:hypothetical protein ABW16_12695 [Mycolicibacter heraklionensis]|uniref:DUF559 domain-containing protein n=1 Tax=Mycolicibacter heraklionensis TaxID=512402 RepID=A0A9X7WME2_9MYCO|nr:hypothetical protein [Mycolicibacter heraklionensis]KLO28600.1 hypothetical protein ABW16_12695 [Mycolicibacter heraklionensis]QZA10034.1 hypothetical protein K3U94_08725 [Mycolicibacter heraklionensis]